MSISPFSARPASPEGDSRRARLALLAATVGIAATLIAYAVSPGVRQAVGHAEHSVKHAVGHVFHHHHKPTKLHATAPGHARAPGHATRRPAHAKPAG